MPRLYAEGMVYPCGGYGKAVPLVAGRQFLGGFGEMTDARCAVPCRARNLHGSFTHPSGSERVIALACLRRWANFLTGLRPWP